MSSSAPIALRHEGPFAQNVFIVSWCFFTLCNYDCSYCPPALKDGAYRGYELEVAKRFCQSLLETHPHKKFLFELTGGEITYYRHLVPFLAFLKERNCDVAILSNGSRTVEWWRENRGLFDHVCLSFHSETAQEGHFREVIRVLSESCTVHLNVMMKASEFERCHQFAQEMALEFKQLTIGLQHISSHPQQAEEPYSAKQRFILEQQPLGAQASGEAALAGPGLLFSRPHLAYRGQMRWQHADGSSEQAPVKGLIAGQGNRWQGWDCHAGLEHAVVTWNGSVYRGWCRAGGAIGHVEDQEFHWPTTPLTCPFERCHHGIDIMCTKERRAEA